MQHTCFTNNNVKLNLENQKLKTNNRKPKMMDLSLDLTKRYTYADYLTWADDKVCELINGIIKMMSPAARPIHQDISTSLVYELKRFIKKNKGRCKVYPNIDVRLPMNGEKEDEQIYNVVRSDISVICDLSKIDDRGCLALPT